MRIRRTWAVFVVAASMAGAQAVHPRALPLRFEPNAGQFPGEARFAARARGYSVVLESKQFVLQTAGGARIRIGLPDSSLRLAAENALPGKANYLLGADPHGWRTEVPTYSRVAYRGSGFDLAFYGREDTLEFDLVVKPGADPRRLTLPIHGARTHLDAAGDLLLDTGRDQLRIRRPTIYQDTAAGRTPIDGGFRVSRNGRVSFWTAAYDTSRPLVVDPVLVYSGLLGGSSGDTISGVALDSAGNIYVTGSTMSTDFPTKGPVQATLKGALNAFVAKFDPTGSQLIYCTYLGGSGSDKANGIAVDGGGNAYIAGTTNSTDFPLVNALQSANRGGTWFYAPGDAFVAKLNAAGTALVYSTYLGGSDGDTAAGIAVDGAGSAYVVGTTISKDFPVVNALQPLPGDPYAEDAFVAKLSPAGNALVYSTYLGGNQREFGYGIALDSSGSAYVTGSTNSANFPVAGSLRLPSGGGNAFVSKLSPTGSTLIYSTFFGSDFTSEGDAIAVDASGNAYVTGYTYSPNSATSFPTLNPLQPASGGSDDVFLTKINAAGSALVYSTYLGGSDSDRPFAIALDSAGNVFVAGRTASTNFPSINAVQPIRGGPGGFDNAFVAEVNSGGNALLYSTYLGGAGYYGYDQANGIAVTPSGSAVVVGAAGSGFPTTTAQRAGGTDGFIAMISGSGACSNIQPSTPSSFLATGGVGLVAVSAPIGCAWTASSNDDWLTITFGQSGSGPGSVIFNAAPYSSSHLPQGSLTIAGHVVSVSEGRPILTALSTSTVTAGGPAFVLQVQGANFTAGQTVVWNGSARVTTFVSVNYLLANITAADIANPGTAQVSVSDPVGGPVNSLPVTIVPSGSASCPYALNPPTQFFFQQGGTAAIAVTTATGCSWTAVSDADWLSANPASGSGSGTFNVVAAASDGTRRLGTIVVAGQVLVVTQDKNGLISLSPSAVDAGGPDFVLAVTGTGFIPATRVGPDIVSGSALQINGVTATTTYVDSNLLTTTIPALSIAQPGTLQITAFWNSVVSNALPLTVRAPGPAPCSYQLTSSAPEFPAVGGTVTVAVAAPAGCAWNVAHSGWITLESPAAGSGNGTVVLTAPSPNTSGNLQDGYVFIGGKQLSLNQAGSIITSISPSAIDAGLPTLFLTVNGQGFRTDSKVYWNGSAQPTGFVSPTQLQVNVPASLVAAAGTAAITVFAPQEDPIFTGPFTSYTPPTSGTSNSATLTIRPLGCSYALASTTRQVGASGATITVGVQAAFGCGWNSSSDVPWIQTFVDSVTGSAILVVAANPGISPRATAVMIAGLRFTVSQCGVQGCTPSFGSADVQNAASEDVGLSPGSLVTIFGYGLTQGPSGNAPETVAVASQYPLPSSLNATSVTMNGVAAPILAIANARPDGRQQINVQVPYELAGAFVANVVVTNNGVTSPTVPAFLAAALPGVFADFATGIAVAMHQSTGQLVNDAAPAVSGETVTIYATGLGPVKPQPATGALPAAGTAPASVTLPKVTVGGQTATVVSSGLAPDVAGLFLVSVRVPAGLAAGRASLVLSVGGASSKQLPLPVAGN
jgi:uncharacterized protein (TIGR03437 family)